MIQILNPYIATALNQVYVQYPGRRPPSEVFGGTWISVLDDEGAFFRAPGGKALPFNDGLQTSKNRSHNHSVGKLSDRGMLGDWNNSRGGLLPFGVGQGYSSRNGYTVDPIGGDDDETRPDNYTMLIWERIK